MIHTKQFLKSCKDNGDRSSSFILLVLEQNSGDRNKEPEISHFTIVSSSER